MKEPTRHEEIYRTKDVMEAIATRSVLVFGAGAVGGNLVEGLARQGFQKLAVVDRDKVEPRNLSTQPYGKMDVGLWKVAQAGRRIYRDVGVELNEMRIDVTEKSVAKVAGSHSLLVDAFDNPDSRRVVKEYAARAGAPCLHVGISGTSEYAEGVWNEVYKVPSHLTDDACDNPLARNLVMIAVALAAETLVRFIASGEKRNFSVTFKDFNVLEWW